MLSIVARVAEALAYAHTQGVVHRDIKPANIMCDLATDTVKVTDFGIARITDSSKTKTGVILGTPSYMSPEQVGGEKIDGRSDLFSLGVMLYQMLTGQLPFQADSLARLMYMIANEPTPNIRELRGELSEHLAHIVFTALNKTPEARYQDGNRFAADVRAAMAELSGTPVPKMAAAPASAHVEQTVVMQKPAAAQDYARTVAIDRRAEVRSPEHARTVVIERAGPEDGAEPEPPELDEVVYLALPPDRAAAIEVLSGPATGRTMDLSKERTALGKAGAQVGAIEKRATGYYLVHVEGAFPLHNGAPIGVDPVLINQNDTLEIAGTSMRFFYKQG